MEGRLHLHAKGGGGGIPLSLGRQSALCVLALAPVHIGLQLKAVNTKNNSTLMMVKLKHNNIVKQRDRCPCSVASGIETNGVEQGCSCERR